MQLAEINKTVCLAGASKNFASVEQKPMWTETSFNERQENIERIFEHSQTVF